MWLGVDLGTWHPKNTCVQKIGLCAQNMLTIIGLMMNMIVGTYMTT